MKAVNHSWYWMLNPMTPLKVLPSTSTGNCRSSQPNLCCMQLTLLACHGELQSTNIRADLMVRTIPGAKPKYLMTAVAVPGWKLKSFVTASSLPGTKPVSSDSYILWRPEPYLVQSQNISWWPYLAESQNIFWQPERKLAQNKNVSQWL